MPNRTTQIMVNSQREIFISKMGNKNLGKPLIRPALTTIAFTRKLVHSPSATQVKYEYITGSSEKTTDQGLPGPRDGTEAISLAKADLLRFTSEMQRSSLDMMGH
ncbi:unnamed protein product [Hermetia illucens]|uniref:Uncharacterized protein n=1 Tax=Hermetia illucens TaxID=343691 RepID=A0A7R8YTP3_HERIL|nr:unnamed protein product [Hermetia illucens]